MCTGGRVIGGGVGMGKREEMRNLSGRGGESISYGERLALPGNNEYPYEISDHGFEMKIVTFSSNHQQS